MVPQSRRAQTVAPLPRALRRAGTILVVPLAAAAVFSPAASPQSLAPGNGRQGSDRPRVRLELAATPRGAATGTWAAKISKALSPGSEATLHAAAGSTPGEDLCDVSVASEPTTGPHAHAWTVRLQAAPPSAHGLTVLVTWRRVDAGERASREDTRSVSLAPGEEHVIDVARSTMPSAACPTAVLRLVAEASDPWALPQALATWDLWLVPQTGDARRAQHREITGPAGVDLPFYFAALRWRLNGEPLEPDDVTTPGLSLAVSGSLNARRVEEGRFGLHVKTRRVVGDGRTTGGGEGSADLQVTEGETLALAIPQPAGTLREIDLARFFEGNRFSLYIRLRPRK